MTGPDEGTRRLPVIEESLHVAKQRQEGDTLIVPVIEEMLVTVKRLVLVEEVRITRVQGTHRKPQTFTLRKEHIEIERLAGEDASTGESS